MRRAASGRAKTSPTPAARVVASPTSVREGATLETQMGKIGKKAPKLENTRSEAPNTRRRTRSGSVGGGVVMGLGGA
jgi:hypothetical protein